MRTVTVDIVNEKAMRLLRELESLDLIKLRGEHPSISGHEDAWKNLKGAMAKQDLDVVEKQLKELREGWE